MVIWYYRDIAAKGEIEANFIAPCRCRRTGAGPENVHPRLKRKLPGKARQLI
jgi:hypothetical protein